MRCICSLQEDLLSSPLEEGEEIVLVLLRHRAERHDDERDDENRAGQEGQRIRNRDFHLALSLFSEIELAGSMTQD